MTNLYDFLIKITWYEIVAYFILFTIIICGLRQLCHLMILQKFSDKRKGSLLEKIVSETSRQQPVKNKKTT